MFGVFNKCFKSNGYSKLICSGELIKKIINTIQDENENKNKNENNNTNAHEHENGNDGNKLLGLEIDTNFNNRYSSNDYKDNKKYKCTIKDCVIKKIEEINY